MNLYNKICIVVIPDNKSYVARVVTDNGYIVQVRPLGHNVKLTVGKSFADNKFDKAIIPTFYS